MRFQTEINSNKQHGQQTVNTPQCHIKISSLWWTKSKKTAVYQFLTWFLFAVSLILSSAMSLVHVQLYIFSNTSSIYLKIIFLYSWWKSMLYLVWDVTDMQNKVFTLCSFTHKPIFSLEPLSCHLLGILEKCHISMYCPVPFCLAVWALSTAKCVTCCWVQSTLGLSLAWSLTGRVQNDLGKCTATPSHTGYNIYSETARQENGIRLMSPSRSNTPSGCDLKHNRWWCQY